MADGGRATQKSRLFDDSAAEPDEKRRPRWRLHPDVSQLPSWHEGHQSTRFAAVRVRVADRPMQRIRDVGGGTWGRRSLADRRASP